MDKLCYCIECKRIFDFSNQCKYCNSEKVKILTQKSPVNVIGSKLKGRFLKFREGNMEVLFVDDKKNKSIKPFEPDRIKKIL